MVDAVGTILIRFHLIHHRIHRIFSLAKQEFQFSGTKKTNVPSKYTQYQQIQGGWPGTQSYWDFCWISRTFFRPMEKQIQVAFAIQLAVYGIAHLLQPGPLVAFYQALASKKDAGVICIALLSLITGSFLVAFHNVWTGLPILLTIFGWAQLVKGTLYMLIPSVGLRFFERITPDRTNHFRWPGIPLLVVSALLAWHLVQQ